MKILVVAAHPDDEVLGCGGTLARLSQEGHTVHTLFLADGESSRTTGKKTASSKLMHERKKAADRAKQILGCSSIEFCNLMDNRLDGIDLLDIVKIVEKYIHRYSPELVFTHHAGDLNIDHRIAHEAVITACRPQPGNSVKELLFFEIPSSTEWCPPNSHKIFTPTVFVDISSTISDKLKALQAYENEMRHFPHPRSIEAVEALTRWRGATIGVPAAEAYILGRKII